MASTRRRDVLRQSASEERRIEGFDDEWDGRRPFFDGSVGFSKYEVPMG